MTDNTELKRLAEAAPEGPWFGPEYAPGTSYVFDVDLGTLLEYQSIDSEKDACLRYVAAANPAMVLALIAENERLRVDLKSVVRLNNENADLFKAENERLESEAVYSAAGFDAAREEISKLRAEIAGLRTGYEAYERVNAELKAENEALRKRIDDMSPFKGAPLTGPDFKCLACGGYHYGLQGLPCPNMRITASAALGQGEQS